MVQIQLVNCGSSSNGCRNSEWILLDIQGGLEQRPDGIGSDIDLGELEISPDGKSALLHVGNQKMEGTLQSLKTPLALLKKSFVSEEEPISLFMKSIVYKKFVFKTRPRTFLPSSHHNRS